MKKIESQEIEAQNELLGLWNNLFQNHEEKLSEDIQAHQKKLKEPGLDPETKVGRLNLAKKLGEACRAKDFDEIKLAVSLGANLNIENSLLNGSPLEYAVRTSEDDPILIGKLLDLGADPYLDFKRYDWQPIGDLLGTAIVNQKPQIVEYLVQRGISPYKVQEDRDDSMEAYIQDAYLEAVIDRAGNQFKFWWFQKFYDNDLNKVLDQVDFKSLTAYEDGKCLSDFLPVNFDVVDELVLFLKKDLSSENVKKVTALFLESNRDESFPNTWQVNDGRLELSSSGLRSMWGDAMRTDKLQNFKKLVDFGWILDPVKFERNGDNTEIGLFWEMIEHEHSYKTLFKHFLGSKAMVQKLNESLQSEQLNSKAKKDYEDWADREEPFLVIQSILSDIPLDMTESLLKAGVRIQDMLSYEGNNFLHMKGRKDGITQGLLTLLIKYNIAEELGDRKNKKGETPFEIKVIGYRGGHVQKDIEKKKAFYEAKTMRKLFRKKSGEESAEVTNTVKRSVKRKRM